MFEQTEIEGFMSATFWTKPDVASRSFIGGSDARIIMGNDEAALLRLWREKRGESGPEKTCPAI